MENILPFSIILPNNISPLVIPNLHYLASLRCFAFLSSPDFITLINDSNTVIHSICLAKTEDNYMPLTLVWFLPDRNCVALYVPFLYTKQIPAHIRFLQLPNNLYKSKIISQPSKFVLPHFIDSHILEMKIFPDASKLIVTYCTREIGPWCTIFKLPRSFEDSQGINSKEKWNEGFWSFPDNMTFLPMPTEVINVYEQGFPTVDEIVKRLDDDCLTGDEYMTLYNQSYLASNLEGGFYCIAISPDTTRLLAGTNDAEIYVIDSTTLEVLHCKREYGFYKTVTGCHYNPLYGNEEFAVCSEMGVLDIWCASVEDDGEVITKKHHLQFAKGTSNCVYSPDGQMIALTSETEFKTYIISRNTAKILFTLTYPSSSYEDHSPYANTTSSLFFGCLCQVATIYNDKAICLWKIPVIYSLEILCFLTLKEISKYSNIDQLSLPSSLKTQLKYLYV